MSTKHTPGPWKVFRTTDGEKIIGIGQASTGDGVTDPRFGLWCSGEERDANARLIAAAPDLLAAAQALTGLSDETTEVTFEEEPCAWREAWTSLRAAISKATGEA